MSVKCRVFSMVDRSVHNLRKYDTCGELYEAVAEFASTVHLVSITGSPHTTSPSQCYVREAGDNAGDVVVWYREG